MFTICEVQLNHLICTSIDEASAFIQANAASPIEVVTIITSTALSTGSGARNYVNKTRAWRATGLSADLVVAVCRTGQRYKGKKKAKHAFDHILMKLMIMKTYLNGGY